MKFHISIPKSFNNNIYHLISIGNIAIIFNYPYLHNYLIKLHDLSIKLHQPESLPRIIFNIWNTHTHTTKLRRTINVWVRSSLSTIPIYLIMTVRALSHTPQFPWDLYNLTCSMCYLTHRWYERSTELYKLKVYNIYLYGHIVIVFRTQKISQVQLFSNILWSLRHGISLIELCEQR